MPPADPANLAAWYAAHAAALTLYARQFVADAGSAEDVVQEAFVRLTAQRAEPGNVRAWLYTTVRNEAMGRGRSERRRGRRERVVGASRPEWFVARPDDLIDAGAAQEALASLAAEQREVVVLRIYGQASFAEIGQITGAKVSTAYERYRAGLASLKRMMESSCTKKS